MFEEEFSDNMTIFNETEVLSNGCPFLEKSVDSFAAGIAKILAVLALGLFGICGNIFIFILAAKQHVRQNFHYLILNMVSADILVIIMDLTIIVPDLFGFDILRHTNRFWNQVVCKGPVFILLSAMLVSLITLFVITIERFRITSKLTTERFKPHSSLIRVVIVASSWLFSMGLSFYQVVSREPLVINGIQECALMLSTYHGVSTVIVVSLGFVIFVMILLLSVITLRKLLRRSNDVVSGLPDGQRETRRKQLLDAMKMILSSLLLYMCCYVPWGIFQVYNVIHSYVNLEKPLPCIDWSSLDFVLSDFLPLVNSSFSPCIYVIFLSHFHKEAKRLLCRPITAIVTFTVTSSKNSSNPVACDNIALSDK